MFHSILSPHPLAILPHESNKDKLPLFQELVKTLLKQSQLIAKFVPEQVIINSPLGNSYLEAPTIHVPESQTYLSDLSELDKPNQEFPFANPLWQKIIASNTSIPILQKSDQILDAGAIVPLYYLLSSLQNKPELLYITPGFNSLNDQTEFGKAIAEAAHKTEKRTLLISSSNLSNNYETNHHSAQEFDNDLTQEITGNKQKEFVLTDPFTIEAQQITGIGSIACLIGFNYQLEIACQCQSSLIVEGTNYSYFSSL